VLMAEQALRLVPKQRSHARPGMKPNAAQLQR
jgi:hypothetical protein